jgi:pilus assembly protein CpaF
VTDSPMRRLADVPLLQEVPDFTVDVPNARRITAAPLHDEVDWSLVVTLRRQASDEVAGAAQAHVERTGMPLGDADRRLMARSVLRQVVREHAEERSQLGDLWTVDREQRYTAALEDAIFGFGRMQPLFTLPDAENIEIHGYDSVVAQYW